MPALSVLRQVALAKASEEAFGCNGRKMVDDSLVDATMERDVTMLVVGLVFDWIDRNDQLRHLRHLGFARARRDELYEHQLRASSSGALS